MGLDIQGFDFESSKKLPIKVAVNVQGYSRAVARIRRIKNSATTEPSINLNYRLFGVPRIPFPDDSGFITIRIFGHRFRFPNFRATKPISIAFFQSPGLTGIEQRAARDFAEVQRLWQGIEFRRISGLRTLSGDVISGESLPFENIIQIIDDQYHNVRADIYALYVGGDDFSATKNDDETPSKAIGKSQYTPSTSNVSRNYAVLTQGTDDFPTVLAHEIGHILFGTNISGEIAVPQNPFVNPKTHSVDPKHNNNEGNLMYPQVKQDASQELNPNQLDLAKSSRLRFKFFTRNSLSLIVPPYIISD